MLTAARLREDVRPAGLDWITALRAPQVKALVRDGDLQLTLFNQPDLADFTSPDFPASAWWPARTRSWRPGGTANGESLLAAAEADLEKIAAACTRARPPLRGQDTIAVRVDQVLATARSPSTLSPASARTISGTAATRTPSPPRPTRSVRPAS